MKKSLFLSLAMLSMAHIGLAQTFATAVNYPISGTYADHIAKGFPNLFGRTDIIAASGFSGGANDYKLFVFSQDAFGHLATTPTMYSYPAVYPGARAIAAGDLNGDGLYDIVIGYGDQIGIFTQNFLGGLNPITTYTCNGGYYTDAIKITDVNNDGHADIVATSWGGQTTVFFGDGLGGFTKVAEPTAVSAGYDDVDAAKLGTDSLVSILEMGGESWAPINAVRIHSNKSADATTIYTLGFTSNMHGLAGGDFYGTGHKLIAASYGLTTSQIALWRNPSSATVADTFITVSYDAQSVKAGALDCSGRDKIVVLHGGQNKVSVVDVVTGIATYTVACPNNASPDALLLADVNGDGQTDIVTVNSYAGISVLINTSILTDTVSTVTTTASLDTISSAVAHFTVGDTTLVVTTYGIDSINRRDSMVNYLNHCTGAVVGGSSYHYTDTVMRTITDTSLIGLWVYKDTSCPDQPVAGNMTHQKIGQWKVHNISTTDSINLYHLITGIDTLHGFNNYELYVDTVHKGVSSGNIPIRNVTQTNMMLAPSETKTVYLYGDFLMEMAGDGFIVTLKATSIDPKSGYSMQSSLVNGQHVFH